MVIIKKIKVMLVDDEDIVLQDMLTLIDWESCGYSVVACANDSDKALEFFKKHLPDILFVDIRIPQVNGLEFSRQALSIKSNTKIHVLTAYKDFEYAQTAIDIGVVSYQLKHTINKASLLAILDKTRDMINLENEKTLNLKRQFILKTIGEGYKGFDSHLYNENDFASEFGNNLSLVYIKKDSPFPLVESDQGDDHSGTWEFNFDKESLPSEVVMADSAEIKQGSVLLLFGFNNVYRQIETFEIMHRILQMLKGWMHHKQCDSFSIAYLDHCVRFSDLEYGYRMLKEAMQYRIFFGKGAVIAAGSVLSGKPGFDVNQRLNELSSQRHNWSCAKITQVIEEVFKAVIKVRNISEFKNVCYKLKLLLAQLYDEKYLFTIEMCHEKWVMDENDWYCADSIMKWVVKEFESILSGAEDFINISPVIQNVIKYIHENYMNPINPNDIAVIFGMNGTYLSQKFKKETGHTFLDYLTNHRVEIAKILLKSGKYKVYEISEKVGYKTSQYFSSVFKEATGTTPLDFR